MSVRASKMSCARSFAGAPWDVSVLVTALVGDFTRRGAPAVFVPAALCLARRPFEWAVPFREPRDDLSAGFLFRAFPPAFLRAAMGVFYRIEGAGESEGNGFAPAARTRPAVSGDAGDRCGGARPPAHLQGCPTGHAAPCPGRRLSVRRARVARRRDPPRSPAPARARGSLRSSDAA